MVKLFLFDIDRTLLWSKIGHRPAFCVAFKKVYDVDVDVNEIKHPGFTDRLIFFDILQKHGLSKEEIEQKLDEGIKVMIDAYLSSYDEDEVYVYPGVKEALEYLYKKVLLGIVTGNVEEIARAKLRKGKIDHYFKFGGFGSDAVERADIIKVAIERAKKFGFDFSDDVFVFGDSPRDIFAAKSVGAKAVGMATGFHSVEDLREAGADFSFKDWKCKEFLDFIRKI